MVLNAVFAVYGGLKAGNPNKTQASIVTASHQTQFDSHPDGVVRIDNTSMGGNPVQHIQKHFGAIV
jgi:hypothetical protein